MIVGPCTVVSGGAEPRVWEDVAVRVVGAHVAQIASPGVLAAAYPEERLWPARGRVVMPGFVNTHGHLARQLARGRNLRSPAEGRRYETSLSAEDVRWSATAALVEGLHHGITTVGDFHRSGACLDLSLNEVVTAALDVGVRVATCYGASELDRPVERRAAFEECMGFASDLRRRRDGRAACLAGVQAATLDGVHSMLDEALEVVGDQLALHVDLALDVTPAERWRPRGARPVSSHPTLWAHAESAPRGLLGEATARGDVLSAVGAGSTAALLREAGVAWGSDNGLNAPPLADAQHGWGVGAESHYQRLFVHGARWAQHHFGASLGVLGPGAPADMILLDYRPATELSARTLYEHLCAGLLRAPVSGAMVGGEVVMENGEILTVDEGEVAIRARECATRVWERLG